MPAFGPRSGGAAFFEPCGLLPGHLHRAAGRGRVPACEFETSGAAGCGKKGRRKSVVWGRGAGHMAVFGAWRPGGRPCVFALCAQLPAHRPPCQKSRCSNILETASAHMAHAARARHQMCACGKKKTGKSQKAYTMPGVSCAIFGFIFLFFPLTARFFWPIILIMYHHGLVCPCAKNLPKNFVHFADFCTGKRAFASGVTNKRNMLKK